MDGRVTADPAPTWYVISGDWQALTGDRLERCKAAIRNRLPSLSVQIDAEAVVAHALELPFYDRIVDGVVQRIELCQIDLPLFEREGRWLRRWLLVLWDGADDALAIDGSSRVIHDLNERIGLDFGAEGTDEHAAALQFYVRFFCAVIAGDEGTFPIIEHPEDLGWDRANRDVPMVGEATHDASAPGLSGTLARLTLEADSAVDEPGQIYRSPPVQSIDSIVMCYGDAIFRVQVALRLDDRREGARWYSGRVEMTGDSGPIALSRSPRPLLIRTWSAGFASLAAWDGRHESVSLASDDFAALLRHPRLGAAQRGRRDATPAAPGLPPEPGTEAALWSLILRYWGVPDEPPIQVNGDVILGDAVPGSSDRLELDVPVVVNGDVVFPAGVEFSHPIRFAQWQVDGRLRARGARFAAQVELADFTIHNRLPKAAGTDGAPRDPFAQAPIQYHETAVDLDEVRVAGALDLRRLTAVGELSIRGGRLDGDMLFDELLLKPRVVPHDRPILNAERLNVAGSARCRRLCATGLVVFDNIRVEGTLDLSGTVIHGIGHPGSGLRIDRARIAGDLLINERGWSRDLDGTMATLVSGDISIGSTEIGGNIDLTATCVLGSLNLPSSQIGGRIAIGMAGLASQSNEAPVHLLASYVAESVDLDHVQVGEMIYFDGVVVDGFLGMSGLRTSGIRVASGAGPGLVVRGQDSHGRSIRLFGASVGAFEVEALQLGGSCWMVGLTAGPRFRLLPATRPAGGYDTEQAIREQAIRVRSYDAGTPWRAVHDRYIADAVAIAAAADRESHPSVIAASMSSLMVYESRCGGNFELWGLTLDTPAATGPGRRALHIRNTTIDGTLSLHDPNGTSLAPDDDGDTSPIGLIAGGVLVEGGRVGGTTDFSTARVVGDIELRNIELHGGLQAVDAILVPNDETSGGCLSVVNIRSAADILLSGTMARQCLVRNSRIEGDLEISHRTVLATPPPRAQFASLEATGNMIEGRILLQHLEVAGPIDLSDTRAVRGLTIGAESS